MRKQPHEASRRNDKIRPPKKNRWLPWKHVSPRSKFANFGWVVCAGNKSRREPARTIADSQFVVAYRVRAWKCLPCLSYRVVRLYSTPSRSKIQDINMQGTR